MATDGKRATMEDFGEDLEMDGLIERYASVVDRLSLSEGEKHLAHEVRSRMSQLRYLLRRVQLLHRRFAANPTVLGADAPHELTPLSELWLHCEMLYYVAFRIHTILEKRLPFAKGFKAPGVRGVRNHLVEHPEGPGSGVVMRSFLVDWDGPKIKGVRTEGAPRNHMDRGLYANLREFLAAFDAMLTKAEATTPTGRKGAASGC
jgi:hypothetical protein